MRSSGDISFRMPTTCSCAIPRKELLLRVDVEVFENIRRQVVGQDAENDDLIVLLHVEDHLRDVRRRPFLKQLAQAP